MARFCSPNAVALAMLLLGACIPSYSPEQLTAMQLQHNQKSYNEAVDPEAKAFWAGAVECAQKHKMAMGDIASSPYMQCVRSKEDAQISMLEARAGKAQDPASRDHDLKVVACIEQLKKVPDAPFSFKSVDDCIARIEIRKQDQENIATSSDYTEAEKTATPKAWIAFLAKHQDDKRSPEIARKVLAKAADAPSDEQAGLDEEIAKAYPLAMRDMPADRRLLLVGPPGMRVRDIKKMSDAKVATSILVARIRGSKEPYKNFDGDDLTTLKKYGIHDDAVTAMIEVTAKLEDKQKDDEERKALRSELAALKKLVEEKKASGDKSSGQTVQTKDGPMDVLASCAKRLGAMKVCEEIPFPGSTICKTAAESEFPCPKQ